MDKKKGNIAWSIGYVNHILKLSSADFFRNLCVHIYTWQLTYALIDFKRGGDLIGPFKIAAFYVPKTYEISNRSQTQ